MHPIRPKIAERSDKPKKVDEEVVNAAIALVADAVCARRSMQGDGLRSTPHISETEEERKSFAEPASLQEAAENLALNLSSAAVAAAQFIKISAVEAYKTAELVAKSRATRMLITAGKQATAAIWGETGSPVSASPQFPCSPASSVIDADENSPE